MTHDWGIASTRNWSSDLRISSEDNWLQEYAEFLLNNDNRKSDRAVALLEFQTRVYLGHWCVIYANEYAVLKIAQNFLTQKISSKLLGSFIKRNLQTRPRSPRAHTEIDLKEECRTAIAEAYWVSSMIDFTLRFQAHSKDLSPLLQTKSKPGSTMARQVVCVSRSYRRPVSYKGHGNKPATVGRRPLIDIWKKYKNLAPLIYLLRINGLEPSFYMNSVLDEIKQDRAIRNLFASYNALIDRLATAGYKSKFPSLDIESKNLAPADFDEPEFAADVIEAIKNYDPSNNEYAPK